MSDSDQRFMFSPLDDVKTFVEMAAVVQAHRRSKGKSPLQLVWKDEIQRDAFNADVKDRLKLGALFWNALDRDTNYGRRSLKHLEKQSRPGARIGFADLAYPTVLIPGHGRAGTLHIGSFGDTLSASQIASTLDDARLPKGSHVKVLSCSSGAGQRYSPNARDWLDEFEADALGRDDLTYPENSLASFLYSELKDLGFEGTVSGYSTSFGMYPQNGVLRRGGGKGRHFAATIEAVDDHGQGRILGRVRRKDARITFPRQTDTLQAR
jgi:hypothetical protein